MEENKFVLVGGTEAEQEAARVMLVENGVNGKFITVSDDSLSQPVDFNKTSYPPDFFNTILTKTGYEAEAVEKAQAKRARQNKKRLLLRN
jgi:hypothetical protein